MPWKSDFSAAASPLRSSPSARRSGIQKSVTVKALFFGHWRDRVGAGELSLDLPEGATVAAAAHVLSENNPELAGILEKVRIAVGEEFATAETILQDRDELAFLPPMSGG